MYDKALNYIHSGKALQDLNNAKGVNVYYWYFAFDAWDDDPYGHIRKDVGCVSSTSETFPMAEVAALIDNCYGTAKFRVYGIITISQSDYLYLSERWGGCVQSMPAC